MSLGSDIAAALPEARAQAESLMTDTIRLEHVTGSTTDATTLAISDTYATDYLGRGRVQRADVQVGEPVAGEVEFGTLRTTVQLPIAVTTARRGQRVTVVASATDPGLVGAVFAVVGVASKTHATMRRLLCEEVEQ